MMPLIASAEKQTYRSMQKRNICKVNPVMLQPRKKIVMNLHPDVVAVKHSNMLSAPKSKKKKNDNL